MLRLATAASLSYCAVTQWKATPELLSFAPQLVGAVAGALILAGLWTPVAGTLVAAVELWIAFSRGPALDMALLAILGASLAMIGPGGWSIDARLFGRKHIETSFR